MHTDQEEMIQIMNKKLGMFRTPLLAGNPKGPVKDFESCCSLRWESEMRLDRQYSVNRHFQVVFFFRG